MTVIELERRLRQLRREGEVTDETPVRFSPEDPDEYDALAADPDGSWSVDSLGTTADALWLMPRRFVGERTS